MLVVLGLLVDACPAAPEVAPADVPDNVPVDAFPCPSSTTGQNVIVVLPETLAGNAAPESEPVGTVIHHILDLTTAGPHGRATHPLS